jgi:hypothetical protein
MVEPRRIEGNNSEKSNVRPEDPPENIAAVATDDAEEDESDGWGFDDTDDAEKRVEESHDVDAAEDEAEPDAWNWEDDDVEVDDSRADDTNSFPYSLSSIPEPLMELVARVLKEGEELKSPWFAIMNSELILVIRYILSYGI